MSDQVLHVILDGLPAGYTQATTQGSGSADRSSGEAGNASSAIMRIVSAPALGESYNRLYSFRLPDDLAADRDRTIEAVNHAVRSPSDADRYFSSPAGRKLQEHGASLYRELCESSRHFTSVRGQTEYRGENLLLLLQFGDGAGDLASCYWEALYDAELKRFLVPGWTVARYIPASRAPAVSSSRLRVLVAISHFRADGSVDPKLAECAQEDLTGLLHSLGELQSQGIVEHIEVLENPSHSELANELKKKVNLLHFFGHGGVDPKYGAYLILRGPKKGSPGRLEYVDSLEHIFKRADTPELRLVVINACRIEEQAAFGARLVGSCGIPCVITMRATIGSEVIASRHGFTETLYRHIAGGEAVHVAYRTALGTILGASPLETFVPTLTLGTTQPLILVDPTQPATEQVRKENQQRRPPIEDMLRSIHDSLSRLDHQSLAAGLNAARAYSQEPQIADAVGEVFDRVKREMERLSTAHQWSGALRCASTLTVVAELLPPDSQRESERLTEELQSALEGELRSLRSSAGEYRVQRRWPEVLRNAERYLELRPSDSEMKRWLDEARECVSLELSIVTLNENPQSGAGLEQIKTLLKAGEIRKAEALFMSQRRQLSESQANAFRRDILLAKANQAKQKADWPTARRTAEDLRQIDPGNAEAARILADALLEDAATFQRSGEYDKAEDKCQEAASLAPQSATVNQFQRGLYSDRIQQLRGRCAWPEVLELSKKVLANPQLVPIHRLAIDWEREASGYLKLWNQIKIV